MLVEIRKIIHKVKKVDGKPVIDPISKEPVTTIGIVRELIKLDEVRSVRRWEKSHEEEISIEGSVIVLYLTGNKDKPAIEIKVNEDFDAFKLRTGAICCEEVEA